MLKFIKNHIFTLHEKMELLILYGLIMLIAGVGISHFFLSPDNVVKIEAEKETELSQINPSYGEVKGASDAPPPIPIITEQNTAIIEPEPVEPAVEPVRDEATEDKLTEQETPEISPLQGVKEEQPPQHSEYIHDIYVRKGDNFTDVLAAAGLEKRETFLINSELNKIYNTNNLKIGQKISIVFKEKSARKYAENGLKPSENGELEFVLLKINEPEREINITRKDDSGFSAYITDKQLTKKTVKAGGMIESSLAQLANKLEIPYSILSHAVRYYSFDVDFQRDLRKGDKFEVLYEIFTDPEGNKVREGNVLYSLLKINGKNLKIYRFSPTGKDDDIDYYNDDGMSIRKTLLKTPIDGAIISSPFGLRTHPIMGFTKMHKGVDFAAPLGTPIYAGGDGKIEYIGWYKGYGRYIKIWHSDTYSTAYGHISSFAKGMRKGRKVKQGQVVAYVGSTGMSTGPHLHYEIIKNGQQVNPMKVNLPFGKKLNKSELAAFERQKNEISETLSNISVKSEIGISENKR